MQNISILHISTDEKFVDHALPVFEMAFPGANDLVIISRTIPLKYVKKKPIKLNLKNSSIFLRPTLPKEFFDNYDVIVMHSLNDYIYPEIFNVEIEKPVIWLGWGFDYYDIALGRKALFLEKTWRFARRLGVSEFKRIIVRTLKKSLVALRVSASKKEAIERVSIFSPVLPVEYEMVRNAGEWRRFPAYARWNYGTIEDDFVKGFEGGSVDGDAILVGNSASITCNHAESLDLLHQIGVRERKVIAPLSYGDKKYGRTIAELGTKYFGANFKPLTDFMPIEDYVALLKKCGFVIMNHRRQQAVGNIVIMLYLGARIFVREENVVCQFLRELGVVFSTVQELEADPNLLRKPLSPLEREYNRKIVSDYWSRERAVAQTKALVEKALGKSEPRTFGNTGMKGFHA